VDNGWGTEARAVQLLEEPLTAATPPILNVRDALAGLWPATFDSICAFVAGLGECPAVD
jgi:hypothetical protein